MSKTKEPTVEDCAGCRDDFYNRTDGSRCWSLESATFVKARDVPTELRPPYKHIALTVRPCCYRAKGYVRVKPDALDARGYWRS